MDLTTLRHEYARAGLDERDLAPSPMVQLETWLTDAVAAEHPEPNAMTLATVSAEGEPSARIVLLRGLDERGLVFFTNYESSKGRDLAATGRACANFFWVLLERQCRVTARVEEVPRAESEAYFATRPRESQIGAWASRQSEPIDGRAMLEARVREASERFPGDVPCPPRWGGYRLVPERVEFWQGRPSRLHDRLRYTRTEGDRWTVHRLSP